jgi:hypothetical protein
MGNLHEDQIYSFDHISLNSCLNEKVSDISCRENQNTHFVFNNIFPPKRVSFWDNVGKKL